MTESGLQILAAIVFAIALLHTFSAPIFLRLAHRSKRHGGLLHLLGEVEVVFGFWAAILLILMALAASGSTALAYAESRNYTEPAFVFVVMVIAASLPVLTVVMRLVERVARVLPVQDQTAKAWLCLALVPLAGSLVTEPAAMTIAAMMLAPQVFHRDMPERLKYLALGVLFVNISIGGTLTSYAAPPVLMVASTWGWDSAFMFTTFGWKAALAVLVNATLVTLLLRPYLRSGDVLSARKAAAPMSPVVIAVHLFFLAAVVFTAHHPIIFLALFLFFIGYTQAYKASQSPLIIKEALLVGFFLAGLVVLGGMQQWWLQPIVSGLEPNVLFVGALALTAITDNAALTYLGSLIDGISGQAQYMLVAGAVAGGGLTVIANAPNPAGVALLRGGFANGAVGMLGLLSGALVPTAIAAAFLFFL
ncbi:putative Na+/H+ antiporter [Achromobacter mucicolens]|uniref:putative Na+/H+ antiporter n=1 Tax=Achromobacter mucicolens TaxID=1389922 RepID=UPI001CBBB193|nr:putative Na+/H+ antiporter [Achromobacter mucicolens]MDH1523401.1 putative Na+/H+ antiporter [Achromobacter mucicolens]UAN03263.1 putative Na+/H+ antiporter [Achromobacter mucicolens]